MKSTKMMLFAALTAGSLLAWNPTLRAQDSTNAPPPNHPPGMGMKNHGPNIDMLAKALNLTDDQKTKVQPIFEAQAQKRREIFRDTSLTREEKIAKMKTAHEDMAAQLKPILTSEQFDKWEKMTTPHTRHMAPHPESEGTNAPPSTP
jgi:Spy/CpxP family protein refolding chaperone